MDQTAKLLDTLKAYLKSRDITYRNLAQRLKLSESSIKRVFSEKTLSLKRLERFQRSTFPGAGRKFAGKSQDADFSAPPDPKMESGRNSGLLRF